MKPKYIRAKEVASFLGIGLSTVWHYSKIGKLTPKKVSSRVTLFSLEEIEKLVSGDEVETAIQSSKN